MYDLAERASGTKQDFRPFWAQLTAYDGSKYYTWTEQQFTPATGAFTQLEGGRFGSNTTNPVFDINGAVFTLPTFALVTLANYDPTVDWRYAVVGSIGSGFNLTDEYDNGSAVFTGVNTQLWSILDFVLTGVAIATLGITGNPTGGSFALIVNGQPIVVNWNESANAMAIALGAIAGITVSIVTGGSLPGTALVIAIAINNTPPTLTLGTNNLTGGTSPHPTLSQSSQPRFQTRGGSVIIPRIINTFCLNGAIVNTFETESYQDGLLQSTSMFFLALSITGGPTGGTFTLTIPFSGINPVVIQWNATAAQIQTALLVAFPTETFTVTGGPLPNVPMQLASTNGSLQIGQNNLTGGNNPTVTLH